MVLSDYDVTPYRSEFRTHVVGLMQHLWGDDIDRHLSYFRWKYEENPYAESTLGIVSLFQGEPAGFRGYFATRFEISEKNNDLILLFPGDTCVHPAHRRKGLSVAMGNTAMKEYAQRYRLFFNTTCTRNSLPGYRKMGFFPLAPKFYLTRAPLRHLIKYIASAKEYIPLSASKIRFGTFGKILVSHEPMPEGMNSLVAAENRAVGNIKLFQDSDFFLWRFRNQRNKYVFYYLMEKGIPKGYVVMGASPNNQRAYILDYSEKTGSEFREILRYAIKAKHFNIISIYDFCLNDALRRTLKSLGFQTHSLVRTIERRLHGELPLLIRPVKEAYDEEDFLVEGLDVRRIENWSLKPICSDAA